MPRETSRRTHGRSRRTDTDGTAGVARAASVEHAALACEPPVVGHDHAAVARILHALAEPHRLSMVHLLARAEHRVVDLTSELRLAQSTVSVHLATLRDAGLVDVRREGRSSWYRLARPEVAHILADAERVVEATRGGSR
ncbi:metalloregulator ArsR/SmtB family transcription factor [Oerskovia sp. M15]